MNEKNDLKEGVAKRNILSSFIQKKWAKYPVLASSLGLFFATRTYALMIGPEVYLRPSIAFVYTACTVLPYPYIWVFPILAAVTSPTPNPLQVFLSIATGVHVAFFLSRILRWRKSETASRVVAMTVATYVAQLQVTFFKSITGTMPFFTYLPLGMVKASFAAISIVVVGVSALWLLQYFGIVNFGGTGEGLRFPRRIPELARGLQAWFISIKQK